MNTYNIGPLTMECVFKRTGLTNVSDMQVVFDAMEAALDERYDEGFESGSDERNKPW